MRMSLDKEVDLSQLNQEINVSLGRQVVFSAQMPGQLDEDGQEMPGVLVVLDATTGEPLSNFSKGDEKKVKDAIKAHVFVAPVDKDAELVTSLESATTFEELKSALVRKFKK